VQRGGRSKAKGTSGSKEASPREAGRRAKPPRPADPRRTAYDVLAAVRDRDAYANLLLPKLLAERRLTGRDAALATELAYGTLRGQGTYDAVLAACSDRPLAKLDPPVLDVLRLGTHQLLNTRIGAHAAVTTSVDLAKSVVGPRASGFVNAVLRRVATRDLETWLALVAPNRATDVDGYLATRYSHPRWIVAAYRAALGDAAGDLAKERVIPAARTEVAEPGTAADTEASSAQAVTERSSAGGPNARVSAAVVHDTAAHDTAAHDTAAHDTAAHGAVPAGGAVTGGMAVTELEAALAAGNLRPKVTLATFPSGPPREDVMPADAGLGRWSPYAFTLQSGDPASLIESGAAAVQDEGSQLAAIALSRAQVSPRTGRSTGERELWLDMCAGPGGKSRLLYGLAAGEKATLIAAELHPHRAALVAGALTRASSNAMPPHEVIVANATVPAWHDGTFDRVLLDVPCSGLGALRRRPEARWRKSQDDLEELTALQRDLLRSALTAVRPGGVVAYVTCSPVPAETRGVVTDVVAATPGVEILDTPAVLPGVPDLRSADPLFAQLWPHRHGTDAIFIALLRRTT
jgi:16S rRNA (cytosine967-C5)-methyltransferase